MIDKSEQINELAAALAKAQAAIQPAAKDAQNLGFKDSKGKPSKYADLAAVWEACRAPLSANGLSVIQLPADAEPGRAALTSVLMHASGQYISSTFSMKLMQKTPHGSGSALTYLRRYALAALVGVVADEDDDGNAASNHQTNGKASEPASNGNAARGSEASDKQIGMLRGVWKQGGFVGSLDSWIVDGYGVPISQLTKAQASDAIETLQGESKASANV
jgi:uncharacterized protein YidB (DUF937 family)